MNRQKRLVIMAATAVLLLGLVAGLATAQAPEPADTGPATPQGPDPSTPLGTAAATPLDTSFTYQGQLIKDGTPFNDTCDVRFTLYDAGRLGNQVGSPVEKLAVTVTGGLFTVDLDFGSGIFTGQERWLEVAVSCPASASPSYTLVGARQELTATPYALYAAGNWGLSGNAGTTAGTQFLGTTDNQALEIKVNSMRALRIEPNATSPNLIGGFSGNTVAAGSYGATVGGGGHDGAACGLSADQPCWNRVWSYFGTVGGGVANSASGQVATVGGGEANSAGGENATIGGGYGNIATGQVATVGGGESNFASGVHATIAGGLSNTASGDQATVGGGWINTASGWYANVGGGVANAAGSTAANVGGGANNTASGGYATVGGGEYNTASGGDATVGGGDTNTASGYAATVAGGRSNTAAGSYSFAAGRRAKANHDGSFVWGDATDADIASEFDNQFVARASGGAFFYTNNALATGVYVGANSGAWNSLSDRNAKENFTAVDGQALLDRLATVPITTWNYKGQDAAIRHIGPVAQDFYAAFGVGEDDKHISTLDPDGVALAASQALYSLAQEQASQIAALQAQNAALESRLAALEAQVSAALTHPGGKR